MWKQFIKDGKAYYFEVAYPVPFVQNGKTSLVSREQHLIDQGYMPIFDRRKLSWINGRAGTAILENDAHPPDNIIDLQNEIKSYNENPRAKHLHLQYCSLHPEQLKELNKHVEGRQIKNILIDSLFKNIAQFRYVIKHSFSNFIDVNFFINSRGSLIETLQYEVAKNMNKYEMRNSYYKHGGNDIPYFNDLYYTLYKNFVYEIDGDIMKRIKINAGYEKCDVYYDGDYHFMKGDYKIDDSDIMPKEKKSMWEE
jgi:hypothetical protein